MSKVETLNATTSLTGDLDIELENTQNLAQDANTVLDSGHQKGWLFISRALPLFFKTAHVPGYLEEKYEEAGIRYRTPPEGSINPTPWIRLLTGLDPKTRASRISDYARSFLGLYEDFKDDPRRFDDDFGDIVFAVIEDKNGIKFFRGEREKSEADLEKEENAVLGEDGSDDGKSASKSAEATESARDALLSVKLSTAQGLPALVTFPAFPGTVANDNGLITFVGRAVPGSSDVEIVAASGDDDVLDEVMINAVQPDLSKVPLVSLLLADALCTHAVPQKLDHLRAKYFDKSPSVMRRNTEGKLESVAISPWLLIDPQAQEIVVSKTPQAPSGITHVKPKSWTLHDAKPVALMGSDRPFVERNLIAQGELPIWTAEPGDRLVENTDESEKPGYCVDLITVDGSRARRLHFHALDTVPTETNNGLRIPETMPDVAWTIKASAQDFKRFADRTSGKWSEAVGAYINRSPNRSIGVQATPEGITVHWWYDKDRKGYMESFDVPFDRGSKTKLVGIPDVLDLAPKDAMPMFGGIASLPLATNEVLLQGTKDGLYITCETDLAHHRCFLPAMSKYDAWAKKERQRAKNRSAQANKANKAKKANKGGA